ncbi:uncharacterized protein LOC107638268 isoform X4 [Arachis ipaensis]|uniref:uncharacterized protein LOC107638268 isoform X4 n=2 Tax=Arachis ipaensis TaxID=130454 RepID=UPI0007AFD535|nr:uncharacterized protein LOC107638268 isoform X4 [Arachis ipaensis]XP_020960426.1 uncharacterized protein LOC107638268 isoform X4 [Arachis ipaensis]XP_025630051.1 uncharacterized protein LOC112723045 isoform X5 [Arachis hypogaea]
MGNKSSDGPMLDCMENLCLRLLKIWIEDLDFYFSLYGSVITFAVHGYLYNILADVKMCSNSIAGSLLSWSSPLHELDNFILGSPRHSFLNIHIHFQPISPGEISTTPCRRP